MKQTPLVQPYVFEYVCHFLFMNLQIFGSLIQFFKRTLGFASLMNPPFRKKQREKTRTQNILKNWRIFIYAVILKKSPSYHFYFGRCFLSCLFYKTAS
jgi:hypothetical protein